MTKRPVERELILKCYNEGYRAFEQGKKFRSPDNSVLRLAYSMGYEDALNSTSTDEEDIISNALDG